MGSESLLDIESILLGFFFVVDWSTFFPPPASLTGLGGGGGGCRFLGLASCTRGTGRTLRSPFCSCCRRDLRGFVFFLGGFGVGTNFFGRPPFSMLSLSSSSYCFRKMEVVRRKNLRHKDVWNWRRGWYFCTK